MPNVCEIFAHSAAKTVLAPMAGYTDFAFRKVCRTYGVALTVTEMVSSKALVMNNALTRIMLKREDGDAPCFCQVFGHEPQVMADSVLFPEVAAYEGVDINMGCPVHKIVSNGDGSALMEHPELAAKCISAVRQALPADKPLSVKFRLGVTDDSLAVDFAKMCRDSGADFVTVHFRTRKQMYAGNADFRLLDDLVATGIPVVANGDVRCKTDYDNLISRGAFAVAVGRSALGNPQIFAQIACRDYDPGQHFVANANAVASVRRQGCRQRNEETYQFLPQRQARCKAHNRGCKRLQKHCRNARLRARLFCDGGMITNDKYSACRTGNSAKHRQYRAYGSGNGQYRAPCQTARIRHK